MAGAPPGIEWVEDLLSRPANADVELMRGLPGDILVLGVGGKMGPTLARLAARAARRAGKARRVIGVSRFSDRTLRRKLESWGVETVSADLLRREEVEALPDAHNVVFMVGRKFGTRQDASRTWATNAYIPCLAAERFAGARMVALSSGNIYPLSNASGSGCAESGPVGPVGEYAQSVLARERLLAHFSQLSSTPMAIMRLNYAVEPRYGILREVADKVISGRPVGLAMGNVNVIWQRDANSIALRLLEHCRTPPFVLNVTGSRNLSVRRLAGGFGRAFGVVPEFRGREEPTALLSDASHCRALFGRPSVGIDEMIGLVARWVRAGGELLDKPTHFERRDGSF